MGSTGWIQSVHRLWCIHRTILCRHYLLVHTATPSIARVDRRTGRRESIRISGHLRFVRNMCCLCGVFLMFASTFGTTRFCLGLSFREWLAQYIFWNEFSGIHTNSRKGKRWDPIRTLIAWPWKIYNISSSISETEANFLAREWAAKGEFFMRSGRSMAATKRSGMTIPTSLHTNRRSNSLIGLFH